MYLPFSELIILAIIVGAIWYMRATRQKDYWKHQGVPYEPYSLFFGTYLQRILKPFHLVDQDLYKKHGRLFGLFEDGIPALYVGTPELLKYILVKDFSQNEKVAITSDDPDVDSMMTVVLMKRWKKLKAVMTPAFTPTKLRKIQKIIQDCMPTLTEALRKEADKAEDMDIKIIYRRFAVDSGIKANFGTEVQFQSHHASEIIGSSRNALYAGISLRVILKVFFQKFMKTLRRNTIDAEAFQLNKATIVNIMKQRKQNQETYNDFLGMMMNALNRTSKEPIDSHKTTQSGDSRHSEHSGMGHPKPSMTEELTQDEILAQTTMTFMFGPDTIATLASITTYLLAANPVVQEKLREEADACFKEHGNAPSYTVVSKLTYLNAVMCETLRMYPPFTRLERTASQEYVLGDTGIKVPKDSIITVPIYAMHHDPEFFPEPDLFKPERFCEENIEQIRPFTYLPFGHGPLKCVGMPYAIQTTKLIILHAVHTVQFVKTPRTKVPIEFKPGYGQLTTRNMSLGIRRRN